ncbi:MAG: glutamate--tRNA ligase [Gammaproteobacteria bacterium]|nr:glutamate--tRNA ligase [Gammaproteobacteria bacterium]
MNVRTRVAPSPTGDPHVGTAYMALFSYCFAKKNGGEFILRIEDTDGDRSSKESEKSIMDALKWLGLDWDEGPGKGGPHEPYRQSQRKVIYEKYAEELLQSGNAFRCFCSKDRLDDLRKTQITEGNTSRYDGACLGLSDEVVAQKLRDRESYVIRMKVPESGTCVVHDELRERIEIAWDQIDMQVLIKADGSPTYHFAVVVDDHLMGITHIIRGEEWINSAPKHILLYQYLGWDMPRLIHMPLLRNPDKSKLSKRKNPTAVGFYKDMGFMPEAVLNYLGMLGWSMPDGEEKFSLDEMVANFDLDRLTLGAPVFDIDKLKWLNGLWLRSLDAAEYELKLATWLRERSELHEVIPLIKERIDIFAEMAPLSGFLFEGMPSLSPDLFESKKLDREDTLKVLQFSLWRLENEKSWSSQSIQDLFSGLAEDMGLKIRDFLAPVFIAISGKSVSPPLFQSMVLLGSDICKARLKHSIGVLGGISKKHLKRLEKSYEEMNRG